MSCGACFATRGVSVHLHDHRSVTRQRPLIAPPELRKVFGKARTAAFGQPFEGIRSIMETEEPPPFERSEVPVLPELMTAEEFIVYQKRHLLEDKPEFTVPDIQRNGHVVWRRRAVTLKRQNNHPQKVFLFERIERVRWEPSSEGARPMVSITQEELAGSYEYRVGYFVVSPKRNKWWWRQSAPFIPADDWRELLQLARAEETLLEGD